MARSGITVPGDCVCDFEDMKLGHKQRCIIYAIKDEKEFYVYKKFPKWHHSNQKKEFEAIVEESKFDSWLLKDPDESETGPNCRNPCVMVWDLNPDSDDDSENSAACEQVCQTKRKTRPSMASKKAHGVLVATQVCPDDRIPVKKKMVFASSVEALKHSLTGVTKNKPIQTMTDLTYKEVMKIIKK